MRGKLGISLLGIAASLGFFFWEPFKILYGLNLERFFEQTKSDRILVDGLALIMESGLFPWVAFFVPFILGCASVLLIESLAAKWQQKNSGIERSSSEITIKFNEKWHENHTIQSDYNVQWCYYFAHMTFRLFVIFNNPVKNGMVTVFTDAKTMNWAELFSTDRALIIELSGQYVSSLTKICIDEVKDPAVRRPAPNVENSAICYSKEDMRTLVDA